MTKHSINKGILSSYIVQELLRSTVEAYFAGFPLQGTIVKLKTSFLEGKRPCYTTQQNFRISLPFSSRKLTSHWGPKSMLNGIILLIYDFKFLVSYIAERAQYCSFTFDTFKIKLFRCSSITIRGRKIWFATKFYILPLLWEALPWLLSPVEIAPIYHCGKQLIPKVGHPVMRFCSHTHL
jgi:hypothetical protein